jgi:sulfotransferase
VHPEVKARPSQTVLPPDLFRRYAQVSFWRDLKDSKAFRIVAQAGTQKQGETMPAPTQPIAPEGAL